MSLFLKIRYSPRRVPGFGLCDGEAIERLWAYLRKFSTITKEMTPVHRDSLLSDGLSHFRSSKIESLGKCVSRFVAFYRCLNSGFAKLLLHFCIIKYLFVMI